MLSIKYKRYKYKILRSGFEIYHVYFDDRRVFYLAKVKVGKDYEPFLWKSNVFTTPYLKINYKKYRACYLHFLWLFNSGRIEELYKE